MLDVYRTDRADAPIQMFIHGGGWRIAQASDYALMGEIFLRAGAHMVIPDFAPVTNHGGDLRPMVEQLQRAVAWVYQNAVHFRGDQNRIYLSGHSSGAHLSGCLMTTDWAAMGLPTDVLKGALLISGRYDLKPVRLSERPGYLTITDEIEEALSPIRHVDRIVAPLIVAYGSNETPEHQQQGRDFAAAVEAAGKPVSLVVAEGYDHFEILGGLARPSGLLGRPVLEQMGLDPG